MLEEAVSTLKEQVNIYEQEVDQVLLQIFSQTWIKSSQVLYHFFWTFQIKEQSRIKESNFEEEISILKTQVKLR